RGRRATTVTDRILPPTKPLLIGTIVVVRGRIAARPSRLDPGAEDRIIGFRELGTERPRPAAIGTHTAFPRFASLEIRQHILVRPAYRALSGPSVVVTAVTSGI